jgi:hypothetical protein
MSNSVHVEAGAADPGGTASEGGAGHPGHHAEPHGHHKKRKAHIEHRVRGRIRMRIPSAKANAELLETYRQAFAGIPGIKEVKAKPITGSIVIHYDPAREAEFEQHLHDCCHQHQVAVAARPGDEVEEMVEKIEAEAEFLAKHSHLAKHTVDLCRNLDRQLKTLSGNTVDLKIVLAGSLAAYTFLEIGAEAATPMWVTLALFTLNHFTELQHHVPPPVHPPVAVPAATG